MHSHVERSADGHKVIHLMQKRQYSDNVYKYIHKSTADTPGVIAPVADDKEPSTDSNDSGVATVVSMVYVTMDPTFSGSVAGYSTATDSLVGSSTAVSSATSTASTTSSSAQTNLASALSSTHVAALADKSATSTVATSPYAVVGTPLAQTAPAAAAATSSSDDNLTASQPQSSGMSDGAKAGLAIGIILALALAAGLAFFCWKRNKKEPKDDELNEKSEVNEKRGSFFGAGSAPDKRKSADSDKSFGTVHTTATAPRLSLRPMTSSLPGMGGQTAAAPATSEKTSQWERRGQNAENPFADASNEKSSNPFEEGDGQNSSAQHSQKSSIDSSMSSGSKSAQVGTAAAVPAGGAAPRGPNNVHRVQLDFKPSMEDELELKSGQLVRMLHEYDDGWALCVRMDRSQQGVAPRTCLSKTPVKPRGPPPPGGRVSPPANMRGPPSGPNSPRPLTPNGQQGPVPVRKPVPGQAM